MRPKSRLIFTLTSILLGSPGVSFAADSYTYEVPLPQIAFLEITHLNEIGDFCGYVSTSPPSVYAEVDGELLTLPDAYRCAGINDNRQIVFTRRVVDGQVATTTSFLYEKIDGVWVETPIPPLPGRNNSRATGFNNAGQVSGNTEGGNGPSGGFIWDKVNGSVVYDPGVAGATNFLIEDINENGDVAGRYRAGGVTLPFRTVGGVFESIELTVCTSGRIADLNDFGDMVGACIGGDFSPFVIIDGVQQIVDVEQLSEINNSQEAIGVSFANGPVDQIIWDPVNGVRVLRDLVVPEAYPPSSDNFMAINHAGQIVNSIYRLSPEGNLPPVFLSVADQTAIEGVAFELQLTAIDQDNTGPLTFLGTHTTAVDDDDSLPRIGAALDSATGLFTWTPGFDQAGNYEFEFTVYDSGSPVGIDMLTVLVTVGNLNRPPVIADIPPQDLQVGQTLSIGFNVSDPDGDPVDIAVMDLPAGATLSADQSTLTWTPAAGQAGTYTLEVVATDQGFPPLSVSSFLTIMVGDLLTPDELIDLLGTTVIEMELPSNTEKKLLKVIQKISKHFDKGKVDKAIKEARKFIREVNEQADAGNISAEDAAELILLAETLIELLGGTV